MSLYGLYALHAKPLQVVHLSDVACSWVTVNCTDTYALCTGLCVTKDPGSKSVSNRISARFQSEIFNRSKSKHQVFEIRSPAGCCESVSL